MYFRITLLRTTIAVFFYMICSDTSLTNASTPPPKEGGMVKFVELNPPLPIPEASFSTTDGKKINLNMFKGAWVLVNFWATWCAPCISELPSLYNLKQNKSSSKFKILLISIDRAGPKIYNPFLEKLGLGKGNQPYNFQLKNLLMNLYMLRIFLIKILQIWQGIKILILQLI